MTHDIERYFERVEKIIARAARGSTENERAVAARLVASTLRDHPMPIRWFVPKRTPCRIVPAELMTPGDYRQAHAVIRTVELHADFWFLETQRVKIHDEIALEAGYFYFERNQYAIFAPIASVTVRL